MCAHAYETVTCAHYFPNYSRMQSARLGQWDRLLLTERQPQSCIVRPAQWRKDRVAVKVPRTTRATCDLIPSTISVTDHG